MPPSQNPAEPELAVAQPNSRRLWLAFLDRLTFGAVLGGALGMILLLVLLTGVLTHGAWPAIRVFSLRFFWSTNWDPMEQQFGAATMAYGTLVTSFLALLIAVPLSLGSALFLVRIAPRRLVSPISFLIELLAAIPSITYGFWGIAVLVPFMQRVGQPILRHTLGYLPLVGELFSGPAYGASFLSASLILAVMVTPIITAVTRDVLRSVPRDLEQGAYGLGATWWQATRVVLAYARPGIFGAVVLGFGRAIGETMAVAMVIGNNNQIKASLFAPGQTMASVLANEFREADKELYVQSLIYVALILLLMTTAINMAARMMITRVTGSKR